MEVYYRHILEDAYWEGRSGKNILRSIIRAGFCSIQSMLVFLQYLFGQISFILLAVNFEGKMGIGCIVLVLGLEVLDLWSVFSCDGTFAPTPASFIR